MSVAALPYGPFDGRILEKGSDHGGRYGRQVVSLLESLAVVLRRQLQRHQRKRR